MKIFSVDKMTGRYTKHILTNNFLSSDLMKTIISKSKATSALSSLKLPKTRFPLSMKNQNMAEKEEEIMKICNFKELYNWQWNSKRDNTFVLHDGPPYANGDPHVGHALNKILKDITNRYKMLNGYRVHYRPGWDCHGMPIEQKVISNLKPSNPVIIRKLASEFAAATALKQKEVFEKWGVMADWNSDSGSYYTMEPSYEANQLMLFYQMYKKGYIYRNYMPVFWSPSSGTALAESEIEYKIKTSTQVYAKYKLLNLPNFLANIVDGKDLFAIIWTTTTWTLPLNRAICFNDSVSYCLVKCDDNCFYIIALNFLEKFSQIFNLGVKKLLDFPGSQLNECKYECPFTKNHLQLYHAHHVTSNAGTGLVHCSPAHGVEDFQMAIKQNLPMDCFVDEKGYYTDDVPLNLCGKNIFFDVDKLVINLLGEHVMHSSDYSHNYPHDWRTKLPVIYRASLQWFMDVVKLRDQLMETLSSIKVYPSSLANNLKLQLEGRDYWCISRQRAWGVPIPVFYSKDNRMKPLITESSINHLVKLFKTSGSDVWWNLPMDELLPSSIIEESGFDPTIEYEKGNDVFDIWFDSGVSWNTLEGCVADVYLEGIDQFNGWFQSSLISSVAVNGIPPYKSLVVHGFALDEDGRKMSKSVGNVINPSTITNGGFNKEKEPAYGTDVLRLWAAASGLDTNVYIGDKTISGYFEKLYKWRKVLRFLIGNLFDLQVSEFITLGAKGDLNFVYGFNNFNYNDQYLLNRLYHLLSSVETAYDEYNYPRVVKLIDTFIINDLSALHCSISKDRLYCGSGKDRISCQLAQFIVLTTVVKLISPILPFLAEEIHLYHPMSQVCSSAFKYNWISGDKFWNDEILLADYSNLLLPIKEAVTSMVHPFKSTDFDLLISSDVDCGNRLQIYNRDVYESDLCELMQVASTRLIIGDNMPLQENIFKHRDCIIDNSPITISISKSPFFACLRCKRKISKAKDMLCTRCSNSNI